MRFVEIAGLVLLTVAASLTSVPFGIAVAGVACLVLAWVNR